MKKPKLSPARVKKIKSVLNDYYSKQDYNPTREEWERWLQSLQISIREHHILLDYEKSHKSPSCIFFCLYNNEEHQVDLNEFMQEKLTIEAYWYWRNHRYELSVLFNNASYEVIRAREYEKERKEDKDRNNLTFKECSLSPEDDDYDNDDNNEDDY